MTGGAIRTSIRRISTLCVAVLALSRTVFVAQSPQTPTWEALDARASELYAKGDLPHAIDAADAALRLAASPRETGRSLDRLGFLYYTSGKLEEGERYLRRSLETRESAFGVDSLEYAETANDLAMLLRDLRRMDEAARLARRAVETRERLLGGFALPLAESLNTLGTVSALAGDYSGGMSTMERALAIHESPAVTDRQSEEYGTLCINLAGTYQRLGKYDAAETTFQKGIDALRVKPGVEHPAYAASLLAYAALEVELGRYVEAERLYDDGGRLVEHELGADHPIYATFLNNRGFLYQSIGNAAAAAASYQQSLTLKRKLYGPGSLLAVATLRNLAHLTYSTDRRAGERLLAEAVDAYAQMGTPPPFDYTSVLVGLARAERDRGAIAEAQATATKAFDVSRAGLGERHPLFAAAMRELGLTLAAAGASTDAEQQLRDALRIAEQVHGPRHPDIAGFLDALADFYVGQRNYTAAERLFSRSLEIDAQYWTDVLEIGSESFKASSMASTIDRLPRLIAFQERAGAELPRARALAFEVVTRQKGRILEQVRSWRQRLEASASPAIQRNAKEWRAIVECRTSLTVALGYRDLKPAISGSCSLPGTELEGRFERLLSDLRSRWTADVGAGAARAIGELQARADALETSLNRLVGGSDPPIDPLHATVADVRRHLSDDEALVEFVSYRAAGIAANGEATVRRYGVFVLNQTRLGWADLGPAPPIDQSVADLLDAARDWSTSVANREEPPARASEQTAMGAQRDLSRRVWKPIAPLLAEAGHIRRLRIAPDAALNLVPFEALSDGRDLIDSYTISYVPAGRDLVSARPATSSSPPVVILSPGTKRLAALENAAGEAADVRRWLPGALLYATANATEQHLKQLHAPSLLHIVGHGVVRGSGECGTVPCVSASIDSSTAAMSLAAIVLEEAYGRTSGSDDDGMLTALELQNMDLRGTELLALSQCQMANGLTSVGEGVYGMRRAAAIAGVHTIVAPLWNVDDRVQRQLINRFYQGLAAGDTRADALRRAKLLVRRSPHTSSFLYWAPVILSGAPGPLPASLFHR
jgi:CHAT domain-containing protein/tetratricopeptide (TPR) repeat protein